MTSLWTFSRRPRHLSLLSSSSKSCSSLPLTAQPAQSIPAVLSIPLSPRWRPQQKPQQQWFTIGTKIIIIINIWQQVFFKYYNANLYWFLIWCLCIDSYSKRDWSQSVTLETWKRKDLDQPITHSTSRGRSAARKIINHDKSVGESHREYLKSPKGKWLCHVSYLADRHVSPDTQKGFYHLF